MVKRNQDSRPTSPHLQIYAWNISSFTSILHRLTGVLLYLSIVLISWYIVVFTYKVGGVSPTEMTPENCDCAWFEALKTAACGAAVFVIFSLYYHFCNGIRHLFWDIGKGFEIGVARKSGYAVILFAMFFTSLTIAMIAYFKFM